jgi:hypothetical protein
MTRKDYILIAGALRDAIQDSKSPEAVMEVAPHIAGYLKDDNCRFDYGHFLAVVRGEKDLNSRPPRGTKAVR